MKKRKIYISGPMSDISELNAPAFREAGERLKLEGWGTVVNPHLLHAEAGDDDVYGDYMRRDIAELVTCDAVYFLPGWQNSPGAMLEYANAAVVGLELISADSMDFKRIQPTIGIGIAGGQKVTTRPPVFIVAPNMNDAVRLSHVFEWLRSIPKAAWIMIQAPEDVMRMRGIAFKLARIVISKHASPETVMVSREMAMARGFTVCPEDGEVFDGGKLAG